MTKPFAALRGWLTALWRLHISDPSVSSSLSRVEEEMEAEKRRQRPYYSGRCWIGGVECIRVYAMSEEDAAAHLLWLISKRECVS